MKQILLACLLLISLPAQAKDLQFKNFVMGKDSYDIVKQKILADSKEYREVIFPKSFIIGTKTKFSGKEAYANFFFMNEKLAVVEVDILNANWWNPQNIRSSFDSLYGKAILKAYYTVDNENQKQLNIACHTWTPPTYEPLQDLTKKIDRACEIACQKRCLSS